MVWSRNMYVTNVQIKIIKKGDMNERLSFGVWEEVLTNCTNCKHLSYDMDDWACSKGHRNSIRQELNTFNFFYCGMCDDKSEK